HHSSCGQCCAVAPRSHYGRPSAESCHHGRTRLHNIASLCRIAEKESTHIVFMGLRLPAILAAAVCVAGCSLVSLKTPERPLSNRDLNARILTREFSYHFIAAVGQCADDMGAGETDPEVLTRALRWKIAAAT